MTEDAIREYLSRLLGHAVAADEAFSLSSARKAQLAAWLRKQGVSFAYADIDKPAITIGGILGRAGAMPPAATPAPAPVPTGAAEPVAASLPAGLGVGIDMQSASALPEAADYRTQSFYRDNFTPREIAHCVSRGDARASFAGLWAAKEAIVKAGAASATAKGHLGDIEVSHDAAGAPRHPGCLLSISHEGELAVAVCIRIGAPS